MPSVPLASEDFHGYHAWRRALTVLPVGTIVKYVDPRTHKASYTKNDIKQNQHFMITEIRKPLTKNFDGYDASLVYELTLTNHRALLFRRKEYWSVEGIAKLLHENRMVLVDNPLIVS